MAMDPDRRLAAVMAADVVGYSRLMGEDEAGTLAALRAMRGGLFEPAVAAARGAVVKQMGDGWLVEFASAGDAVGCAMEVQEKLAETGEIRLRIGVHVGDVVHEEGDIFGDGVNIAARLEGIAAPGGLAISDAAYGSLDGARKAAFGDGGEHALKNIARPVRVWRWAPDGVSAAPALAPPKDKPSIVVLPFDNMSGDPEQEYFADGVVESITAALSRIRSFFVIARNSAFAYKGRARNVREVGRELGVAYVLEGSVQRAGNRVRITVQMVETEGGAHLWAEKYDGALDDIFDLQDRITEQVAGALQPSIRKAEIERARRKRPQDLGAYDYTMRAMRHVWALEREEADAALKLLEKALEIDPDYPLALALAAWCHGQRAVYNWTPDPPAERAEAIRIAEKAARAAEDDPLTLAVLGAVHSLAWNHETARVILERAIALDPNSAWTWSRLGWLDSYVGHAEQAEENFRRAMRLSPLDPMTFNAIAGIGAARAAIGDYTGAVEYFRRALRERPGAGWMRRALTACLVGAGRVEEARIEAERLTREYPEFTIERYLAATPWATDVKEKLAEFMRVAGLPEK